MLINHGILGHPYVYIRHISVYIQHILYPYILYYIILHIYIYILYIHYRWYCIYIISEWWCFEIFLKYVTWAPRGWNDLTCGWKSGPSPWRKRGPIYEWLWISATGTPPSQTELYIFLSLYLYIYIWANYNDLTATSLESWLGFGKSSPNSLFFDSDWWTI